MSKNKLFFTAAFNGNVDALEAILKSGADVNAALNEHGETPLWWACARCHADAVRMLLKVGVDPNCANVDGTTPLMAAASVIGCGEIISALLDAGAEINRADKRGKTALDYAMTEPDYLAGNIAVLKRCGAAKGDAK